GELKNTEEESKKGEALPESALEDCSVALPARLFRSRAKNKKIAPIIVETDEIGSIDGGDVDVAGDRDRHRGIPITARTTIANGERVRAIASERIREGERLREMKTNGDSGGKPPPPVIVRTREM
ncbi:hypothetical protein A2U01_0029761, partial [Trifolium medium]|nr:hypothetical protein [Trifolium medium]